MNAQFLHVDAEHVKAQIADLLTAYPELAEDDQLLIDTLEGSTDLFSILSRLVAERADAESMVAAIKERVSDLTARKARFERRSEAMKKLAKSLMDAAGQTKLTLPEATLSIAKGREKIVVDDLEALVQGFYRTERVADKDAIKAALEAGSEVPGARLVLSDSILTVRTK